MPISLKVGKEIVETSALVDSGAEGQFLSNELAKEQGIRLLPLVHPITPRNVDGTVIKSGLITHYAPQTFSVGNRTYQDNFMVTDIGQNQAILGLPWLQKVNPQIDWKGRTIAIWKLGLMSGQSIGDTLGIRKHLETIQSLTIGRTTTSTELAQGQPQIKRVLEDMIPAQYHEFLSVFDKKAAERFPPSRPCDHAITLKKDFIPRDCKIYQMAPKEQTALDEFIDENLRKGYIRPSKSPMASPFFFVGKKDGALRPCQDYRRLNEGMVKNTYPLPLVADLLDKLKGARYFTKLDVQWGYNNIRIKKGDEWKAAFKTNRGLFEPTVMFFGLCNSPATFQAFMDEIFRMEITANLIIVYMDDILIFSPTLEGLRKTMRDVLNRLRDNDLYLKPEKCSFEQEQVEYLGLIITPDHIAMDPVKLAGIAEWPTLSKAKDIQRFLGFANFYRRFIDHYADIARPLDMIKQGNKLWEWTPECNQAF